MNESLSLRKCLSDEQNVCDLSSHRCFAAKIFVNFSEYKSFEDSAFRSHFAGLVAKNRRKFN